MAKLRLTSDGLVDVGFRGIRLVSSGLVQGEQGDLIVVDDIYIVEDGTQLVVSAATGILSNDNYRCGIIESFDSGFSTAFNGA